jgi:EAL domain-containing protein (putative c-di-GMP-specific phosphodiesterase class I)/CheY-like chemotaxis protein
MEPQTQIASGSRRRVFVIDDDTDFCQLMSRLVEGLGYQVIATDEIKAVDFAQLTASDVLFVDLMMPGTDGIQVLQSLARNRVRCSIVPMSGSHQEVLATAETIARRSGLRVTGVLNKPFRADEVRRLLAHDGKQPESCGAKPAASNINIEDLLTGLERGEFDAFLQPIIDLSNDELVGYEALARWRSEKFSLVSPDRFIALAARNGVLPRLTSQIISRVLAYAVKLRARGLVWHMSVNIGAEDLVDAELPERLAARLAIHDLPPGSLTLELTETSATLNEVAMFGILARMRLKGISLAIDDYGIAYSGLDRVSTIPFTWLKIDKQFISSMMTNRNARMIVESSVAMAKRLSMRTIAEGIEAEDQRHLLQKIGCELGQGHLLAAPMEFEALVGWASGRPPRTTMDRQNIHGHRDGNAS